MTVIVLDAGGQARLVAVSVRTTVPDVIDGVYVEVSEVALLKLPVGAVHNEAGCTASYAACEGNRTTGACAL